MGEKNNQGRQEQKLLRELRASQASITRPRRALGSFQKYAALLLCGAAACFYYYARIHQPSSEYISIDESVKVYNAIKKDIEVKRREAAQKNKPLRIIVLEEHDARNSRVYAEDALDIAHRDGINSSSIEVEDKPFSEHVAYPLQHRPSGKRVTVDDVKSLVRFDHENPYHYVAFAFDKNFEVLGVDNKYPEERKIEALENLIRTLLQSAATVRLGAPSNLVVSVKMNGDIPNVNLDATQILFYQQHQAEFKKLIDECAQQAQGIYTQERNASISDSLAIQTQSSVDILGATHGMGVINPLRDKGDLDITFTPRDNTSYDNKFAPYMMEAIQWARNSQNAVQQDQHTRKDFDPEGDTDSLIDKTVGLANHEAPVYSFFHRMARAVGLSY